MHSGARTTHLSIQTTQEQRFVGLTVLLDRLPRASVLEPRATEKGFDIQVEGY